MGLRSEKKIGATASKVSKIRRETKKGHNITSKIRIRPVYWLDTDTEVIAARKSTAIYSHHESNFINYLMLAFASIAFLVWGGPILIIYAVFGFFVLGHLFYKKIKRRYNL